MMEGKSKEITAEKALQRLEALCARSEQAPADVEAKLRRWGVAERDRSTVVARLRAAGFLDERRYARAYVHDKHMFNGWGRVKIVNGLRLKAIPQEYIDEALEQINADSEADTLLRLLRAKQRTIAGREPRKQRDALLRFAASRGFTFDQALAALDRLSL